MPWTCSTRARVRPPRPAPMIAIGVAMVVPLPGFFPDSLERCSITMLEHRSKYVKMVSMAVKNKRAERRTDALSKERIVEAAIEILDADGENALTFRALSARLATGAGA